MAVSIEPALSLPINADLLQAPAPTPSANEPPRTIPPGPLGKLRIRQSGKVELLIGDISFDVTQVRISMVSPTLLLLVWFLPPLSLSHPLLGVSSRFSAGAGPSQ